MNLFPGPLNIVTSGGDLEIIASVAASVSDGITETFFRVVVDGVGLGFGGVGTALPVPPDTHVVTLMKKVSVPPGTHTVNVQWAVASGLATASSSPSTFPLEYYGSIRAVEIFP